MTTVVAPFATHTQHAELYHCAAGGHTDWLLLRLTDPDGVTGWGECSDAGPLAAVLRVLAGEAADAATCRAVRGAVRQALADQAARRAGQPLWQWLGAHRPPGPVELTALLRRTAHPGTAAADAGAAVAAGFATVRIAPFDSPGGDRLGHLGLARVRAVRAAVGASVRLLVDCHQRLPLGELTPLLAPLARLGVDRLEDGASLARPAELAELRRRTALPLAARADSAGPGQLARAAGLVDLLLVDARRAGGPAAVLELAASGARVGLRNPSGPIATLHSAHLAAALPGEPLEYPFGEVAAERRAGLLRAGERISGGQLLLPAGPGLGDEPDLRHPAVVPLWRGALTEPGCPPV
ncbi:enolase C-terminal domain-like protein [Kitasatospora viridis]|uniref:L-alanine-DL-glutamate epimerase-like enolase superfamily enzyme n=1 Tax=Kitasatospora viridis TaxID=281105 RepID=A0A561ULU9_9ACTN|nr:enolase C-terminal domain-like protein [Kitasatospora viridis]TWG00351.1 L-alanine-DL-glutamate epimerase-like enolase superfamily enzyme [Kitasatospora viridis]